MTQVNIIFILLLCTYHIIYILWQLHYKLYIYINTLSRTNRIALKRHIIII